MLKTLLELLISLLANKKIPEKPPQKNLENSTTFLQEPMYKFSQKSLEKLATCHPDIQKVFNEVIKHVDCTVIEGIRTKEQQEEYVRTGKSKTMNSKHLPQADGYSHAIDIMAYPIKWEQWKRNAYFAGFVIGIAKSMGVELVSGIDWDSDFDIEEHSFLDAPHFELKK